MVQIAHHTAALFNRLGALSLMLVALVALTISAPALAQDAAPAAEAASPTSADPGDRIVSHIQALTRIVEQHKDNPEDVKRLFTEYLDQNGDAMKSANQAFERHLQDLNSDEAQSYQERFQRKLEGPLQAFLTAMLDFSTNHPEAASQLDEMLRTAP